MPPALSDEIKREIKASRIKRGTGLMAPLRPSPEMKRDHDMAAARDSRKRCRAAAPLAMPLAAGHKAVVAPISPR